MSRLPDQQFFSWSYSRRAEWERCPLSAKFKFLDKIPVPPNPAMERGKKIHDACEKFVKGELFELPEELELYGPEFEELRKTFRAENRGVGKPRTIWVEDMWGYDENWAPVAWNDWKRCKLRIKVDLSRLLSETHLLIVDHKSGNFRPNNLQEYLDQMQLYGVGGFIKFPKVTRISTRLVYLDHGITYPENDGAIEYTRDMLPELREQEDQRILPMMRDREFKPHPGNHCRWCPFKKGAGGMAGGRCEF